MQYISSHERRQTRPNRHCPDQTMLCSKHNLCTVRSTCIRRSLPYSSRAQPRRSLHISSGVEQVISNTEQYKESCHVQLKDALKRTHDLNNAARSRQGLAPHTEADIHLIWYYLTERAFGMEGAPWPLHVCSKIAEWEAKQKGPKKTLTSRLGLSFVSNPSQVFLREISSVANGRLHCSEPNSNICLHCSVPYLPRLDSGGF